jgi:hypothetical protein
MPTELIEGLSPPSAEGLVNEVPEFENKIPEQPAEEKPFRISAHGQKIVDLIERYIPVYERETGYHSLPWDQLDIKTKALIASGFVMGLTMSYGTLRALVEHPENIEFKRVTPEGGDYAGGDGSDPGGGDEPVG